MREQRVILEPFGLLQVLRCEGMVCANRHGFMNVKGYIQKEKEEEYLQLLTTSAWATIKVYDEHENVEVLFTGIVTEGVISVENGLKTLEIKIKTGSFLMDLDRHIRAFQSPGCTYEEILASFGSSYERYGYIMEAGRGKSINRFLCQYQETDWEFIRRIGGLIRVPIYPNYIGIGEKLYFGRPAGTNRGAAAVTEYAVKQGKAGVVYEAALREIFDIGDSVSLNGKNLYVLKRMTEFKKSELYHTYTFGEEEIEETDFYANLRGISLAATVTGVKGTSVTLKIHKDEYAGSGRWFPYATVYSSVDGSGWYCMPEKGDCVRLYFPSEDANEAYVLNAVHLDAKNSGQRINPANKSIMNKQGKEILLKPDAILITNNNGMSLELSDEDGISIISDKKITFESEEAIEITSVNANIDLVSPRKISLKQGNTSMVLSENMVMQGTKVRLN